MGDLTFIPATILWFPGGQLRLRECILASTVVIVLSPKHSSCSFSVWAKNHSSTWTCRGYLRLTVCPMVKHCGLAAHHFEYIVILYK